jgi:hypothetical protein
MHNIIGMLALYMLLDAKRKYARSEPLLTFRPDHPDGVLGLAKLREILIYIYVSILLAGATLAFAYFFIPSGTAKSLTPLFLIFFLANPLYIVVPILAVRKELTMDKSRKLVAMYSKIIELRSKIWSENATLSSTYDRDQLSLHIALTEYDNLRGASTFLFSFNRVLILSIGYIGFLVQLIASFKTLSV